MVMSQESRVSRWFYGGVFKGVSMGFEGTLLKGDFILFPECLKGLFKDS